MTTKTSYTASEFLTGLRARVAADQPVLELDAEPFAPDAKIALRAGELAALMLCPICLAAHPTSRTGILKTVNRDATGRITSLLEEPVNIVEPRP